MKKNRNNSNKNSNIIVNFNCYSDKKINKLLKDFNLSGVRVSTIINRWAVDVPFWKEDHYAEKFLESDLVERIYRTPKIKKYQDSIEEEIEND
jgi:hypothetical protein